jgi:polysaccharide export outer membrane protein
MSRSLAMLVIAGQLALSACSGELFRSAPPPPAPAKQPDRAPSADSEQRLEALFRSRGDGSQVEGDYRIGPGDRVNVQVFGAGLIDGSYTVSRDGTILLPLIDQVHAEGQTEESLAQLIAARLGERYFQSPNVEVSVRGFQGQRVTVLGAVRKPGFYALSGPESILDALNQAGGLKQGSGTRLYFTPADPGARSRVPLEPNAAPLGNPIEIDLTPFTQGRAVRGLSLPVHGGDVVYVEEGGDVVVVGWVEVPRPVQLRPGLSVVQAITEAGGLHFAAARGDVEVFRKGRTGPGETLTLDYDKMEAGERRDVALMAGDRIYVGANPIKVSVWAVGALVSGIVRVGIGGFIPLF